MSLISFVIPAYNSENYLHKAVESLLPGLKDIEIIIVNDGSKDKTKEIADLYVSQYPGVVKVIHKFNGGHGSAINEGLKAATAKYIKIIDSDDWVDENSLHQLLNQIKNHEDKKVDVDLYITNFVYEHVEDHTQYERDYASNFIENQVFGWNQIKSKFRYSNTLLMHALVYKTELLKKIGFQLPDHTFYVDNLYAYRPLPYVKHMYYMRLPFYRYFIGRSDQSITLKHISERYEQQMRVQKLMVEAYLYEVIKHYPKGLKDYMLHCMSAIMMITQMFTVSGLSEKRKQDLKELWLFIKQKDRKMYTFLKYRSMNTFVRLPWKIKQKVMVKGYLYLAKKIKLG